MYLWMVVDLWMLSMYIYLGLLCISIYIYLVTLETLVLTSIVYGCIPVDDWDIHRHQVDKPYIPLTCKGLHLPIIYAQTYDTWIFQGVLNG